MGVGYENNQNNNQNKHIPSQEILNLLLPSLSSLTVSDTKKI